MVTEEVDLQPPASGWKDAALVVDAGCGVRGVISAGGGGVFEMARLMVPSSWQALMESR